MKRKHYIYYIPIFIQSLLLILIIFFMLIRLKNNMYYINNSINSFVYLNVDYPLLYPALVFSPILTTIILYLLYKLKIIKEKPKFVKTILLLLIITLYVYHKWGFYMNPF